MDSLAIISFLMIIVLMTWLLKGKTTALIPFVIVPIVAALIAGFSIPEVGKFAVSGMSKIGSVVILFIFSIMYFGIMDDAGLFDKVVSKLIVFAGNDVTKIIVATSIIAMVTHLDGAGSSTFLITIPAMMPLYKRVNISTGTLLFITGLTAGVMNVFPWGGPFIRVGTVLAMDPGIIWKQLIPAQIFGLVLCIIVAIYLGKKEIKNGAGLTEKIFSTVETNVEEKLSVLKRPNLLIFNWILTTALIVGLMFGLMQSHLMFLIATVIALLVNYPNIKDQNERIKAHAPAAISMVVVIIAAGIFLGVFSDSKMVDKLVLAIVNVIPSSLGPILHIIIGIFAAPIGMFIGADPYAYGLLPIILKITGTYGVDPVSVSIAVVLGECAGWAISPSVSTVFLGLGLAGVELKDHLKNSFFITWGVTVLMLLFTMVTGVVKF